MQEVTLPGPTGPVGADLAFFFDPQSTDAAAFARYRRGAAPVDRAELRDLLGLYADPSPTRWDEAPRRPLYQELAAADAVYAAPPTPWPGATRRLRSSL